jgi:DMSO/TMAO reductase YedYZ molybdopterin-dependent catalytic subunit
MPEPQIVNERPYNAGTPLEALFEELTPIELTFVRNHFDVPSIKGEQWALSVGGLVDQPLVLSLDDLQSRQTKRLKTVLECAGNGRTGMDPLPEGTPWGYNAVSAVEFRGTSLADVLEQAGMDSQAVEVVFTGADRGITAAGSEESYARSLPIEIAMQPDTLLAWEMNGQPLTPNHGHPLRLLVPGWYGMASVKWLERIEVVDTPFTGFFQATHYLYRDESGTPDGEPVRRMRVRSLIARPEDGAEIREPEVELAGVAWSSAVQVSRVEVSLDRGVTWEPAELDDGSTDQPMRIWRFRWTQPEPGVYEIMVRATDANGISQPTDSVWNRLGYGNNGPHSIRVSVV